MHALIRFNSRRRCANGWTHGWRVITLLALAVLMLMASGCGMTPTAVRVPSAAMLALEQPPPEIDAALMTACPPLPPASDGTLPALTRNHLAITEIYHACAQGKAALVKAVATRAAQQAAKRKRARQAKH